MTKLFPLGLLVQTPGVEQAVDFGHLLMCLARHVSGDWGEVDAHDAAANVAALKDGSRILSVYFIDELGSPARGKFWIITDAVGEGGQRAVTTVLLPEEY
jgi:hypothetical protein